MSKLLTRDELLALEDDKLLAQCRQECYRASGPGGQHRNTTDSAVRLTVLDGAVTASCADHRSQHRNRADAVKRLRLAIALELRTPQDLPWKGSWKIGQKDRRYAGFIAHVLDVLAQYEWAVGLASKKLGVSTGRLVRILAHDAHAWNVVNQQRQNLGLVALRRP